MSHPAFTYLKTHPPDSTTKFKGQTITKTVLGSAFSHVERKSLDVGCIVLGTEHWKRLRDGSLRTGNSEEDFRNILDLECNHQLLTQGYRGCIWMVHVLEDPDLVGEEVFLIGGVYKYESLLRGSWYSYVHRLQGA